MATRRRSIKSRWKTVDAYHWELVSGCVRLTVSRRCGDFYWSVFVNGYPLCRGGGGMVHRGKGTLEDAQAAAVAAARLILGEALVGMPEERRET